MPTTATRNVLLVLEYEGTDFAGWQRQPSQRTVQGVAEETVARIIGHPVTLRASSRTDAGVHARGLPANFETDRGIPCFGMLRGLNTLLPDDLAVTACRDVPLSFRTRDAALAKTYRYRFHVGPSRRPLLTRTSWYVKRPDLDVDAMHDAAQHLLGLHDFTSFQARGCQSKTTLRFMHSAEVRRSASDAQLIELRITGNAFLRNMVRIIAGTLFDVGTGRLPRAAISEALDARHRPAAGMTAPACGLTLDEVHFDGYPRIGKLEGSLPPGQGGVDDPGAAG